MKRFKLLKGYERVGLFEAQLYLTQFCDFHSLDDLQKWAIDGERFVDEWGTYHMARFSSNNEFIQITFVVHTNAGTTMTITTYAEFYHDTRYHRTFHIGTPIQTT